MQYKQIFSMLAISSNIWERSGCCAYRKSNPAILMVQSAQDRAADDIHRPTQRHDGPGGILVQ